MAGPLFGPLNKYSIIIGNPGEQSTKSPCSILAILAMITCLVPVCVLSGVHMRDRANCHGIPGNIGTGQYRTGQLFWIVPASCEVTVTLHRRSKRLTATMSVLAAPHCQSRLAMLNPDFVDQIHQTSC